MISHPAVEFRPNQVKVLRHRRFRGKCAYRPFRICNIGLELGLRGLKQHYAQMANEISTLNPELELRGLPGKFAQWRR
jgi:hypothetical protein